VSEADQRAATGLAARMPQRPVEMTPRARARIDPRNPYESVAVAIARRIEAGELAPGAPAPTAKELIKQHGIALSTARRAVGLVKEWGLLVNDGHGRPRVTAPPEESPAVSQPTASVTTETTEARFWSVTVRGPDGERFSPRLVRASLDDPESFRVHLLGIVRGDVPDLPVGTAWVSDYEVEVRDPRATEPACILRWS
jgi:integrase